MGKVRIFNIQDISQVIDLNVRLFPGSSGLSREKQEFLFAEICFRNPWYHPGISSLVYEENDGRVTGFLCVVPRHFSFNNQTITVAVGQHLMVDRTALASVQLFKKFLEGPQDLSITDMAIELAKPIWGRFGGTTIYTHSIYWRRILRPLSFASSFLKKEKSTSHSFTNTNPLWTMLDSIVNQIPSKMLHFKLPNVISEELTTNEFLLNLHNISKEKKLFPVYTADSLNWLFARLTEEKRFGEFQKTLVRDSDNQILGWYLYNLKPMGRSEVLQIIARKDSINTILDHLFYNAWEKGSIELCGRLDPQFTKEFGQKYALFMPGRNWMLAHSKNPELIDALHSNEAHHTRLEGDLWFL